ncbi:GNAT family N-acetyltransferase [Caulobacter sp. NIBR1757]|uniref:GNAT family N-acetyltransferase n=1 Tax=Caulobacter sp. NIBR1757 TaxID=3016000 RepID=UPI0022EFF000|nr:GNAT family N-acetyltransferase [Caulobacter sp. NIBR1757]WGM37377.1 N-alpha-acetyltransferase RimI [Caulobacter sp. NIBR1757]
MGTPDLQILAAVHAQAFDHGWSAAEIASLLETPGTFVVAEPEGFILARALAGEAEIITLAVAPAARRRGMARRLVEAAAVRAMALQAEALFLEVADDNVAALGLYRGLGFEVVGRRRGYYARGNGEPAVDALVMRLALNS